MAALRNSLEHYNAAMRLPNPEIERLVSILENGLQYIPTNELHGEDKETLVKYVCFADRSEAQWAIHLVRLFLRPRPILLTEWNSIRGDMLVQVYVPHKHVGYMMCLRWQTEFLRRMQLERRQAEL